MDIQLSSVFNFKGLSMEMRLCYILTMSSTFKFEVEFPPPRGEWWKEESHPHYGGGEYHAGVFLYDMAVSHMVLLQHGHVLIADHFYFVILLSCTQDMTVLSFGMVVFLWGVSQHGRASNRHGRVVFRAVYRFNYFSCFLKLLIDIFLYSKECFDDKRLIYLF